MDGTFYKLPYQKLFQKCDYLEIALKVIFSACLFLCCLSVVYMSPHRPPPPDVAHSDVIYRLHYLLNGPTSSAHGAHGAHYGSGLPYAPRSSQPSPAPSHISLLVTDEGGVTGRRSPREVIAEQQLAAGRCLLRP